VDAQLYHGGTRTFFVFLITCGLLSLSSMRLWVVPLAVCLAAVALTYLPEGRWRTVYCHLWGNDTYLGLAVMFAAFFSVVGFVMCSVVGFILAGLGADGGPDLPFMFGRLATIFGIALLVVSVPVSNFPPIGVEGTPKRTRRCGATSTPFAPRESKGPTALCNASAASRSIVPRT
jgi:hypothetical protein